MSKYRVFSLAKEFNIDNKTILEVLNKNGITVKSQLSTVDDAAKDILRKELSAKSAPAPAPEAKAAVQQPKKATKTEQAAKSPAPHQEKPQQSNQNRTQQGNQNRTQQGNQNRSQQGNQNRTQQSNQNRTQQGNQNRSQQGNQNPPQQNNNQNRSQQGNQNRPQQNNQNRPQGNSNRPKNNNSGNRQQNMGNGNRQQMNNGGNRNGMNERNDRMDRNERMNNGGRSDRNDRHSDNRFSKNNDRNRNNRNGNANSFNGNRNGKMNNKNKGGMKVSQQPAQKMEIIRPKSVKVGETIMVKDLASKLCCTAAEIIKKLMLSFGVMASINQEIDFDTASLVAAEFGVNVEELPPDVDPTEIPEFEDDPKSLTLRPPVVTVMGHVDHGKTSLLDVIRKTSVTAQEAGGITQHIGAYQVKCQGKKIVFLDTPGHEAFTAMRARGAQVTDIAILVVAADDGVMPQTIEAINHAKSAEVPIIVAINKIDKPGADPSRVKNELMEHCLVSEEYGGDTIMVEVSAKKNLNIDSLLEMVILVAEMGELKANPRREARGVIIEAQLDKGRGPVATVLVQNGTMHIGDSIIAGTCYGKIRAMINDRGENVKKAGPSVPVEVLGLNDVPAAGDELAVLEEKLCRSIAEKRIEKHRNDLIRSKKVSLDDLFQQIQDGSIKDLNILVKADVQGSVEALNSSLLALNKNDEVRINIVHSGVGAVNESDVMLATASNALIIAFNVRPDANARRIAESEDIDIRTYRVIYDAINDVKDAMSGMLAPKYKEVIQGRVEIRQVMIFNKTLMVAGSYVLEGKITNKSKIRIVRDNIEVFDGELDDLRRFKDAVKEVAAGYECGITIKDYRDFREGDIIEAYTMEEIKTNINDINRD